MSEDPASSTIGLDEAAKLLELPLAAVEALASSGYLAPTGYSKGRPEFQLPDLKAFLARNADNGAGAGLLDQALAAAAPKPGKGAGDALETRELLDLLDGRAEEMAFRVFKIFSTVFPEAGKWPVKKQGAFVRQAKGRFEAILAVTEFGSTVDEELLADLRGIGASAARSATPLPHLLVLLRMSRDLVVQNAVEVADSGGKPGGYALSLLLTRIMPAMDRLGDAIAEGYWEAISASSG